MHPCVHTEAEEPTPVSWVGLFACLSVVNAPPAPSCDPPHCCLLHAEAWELPVYPTDDGTCQVLK